MNIESALCATRYVFLICHTHLLNTIWQASMMSSKRKMNRQNSGQGGQSNRYVDIMWPVFCMTVTWINIYASFLFLWCFVLFVQSWVHVHGSRPRVTSATCCSIASFNYCVCHTVHVRENCRFISTGMEFSKSVYAYLVKAPSRN